MNAETNGLVRIVEAKDFSEDPATLKTYSQDQSFVLNIRPKGIVTPNNLHDVQEIVKWANETHTPLVPVSSGPPHLHGDTVPSVSGAVIVNLSQMNKIIRIDRLNKMALIEPGVTYAQLQPELAKQGMRLSTSLIPRPNKSVLASLLEREPRLNPRYQWAMLDPLRCLEIVWGDGQRFTTGEAESVGTLEEEWKLKFAQVGAPGPGQTDFYWLVSAAQGSMGIITWASIKCELLPKIHNLYFIPSDKAENLLDLAYAVLRIRFGDELLIMNNWNLASLIGKDEKQIKSIAKQLPPWMLMIGIAGRVRLPEERVAYQEKDLSEMARQYGLEMVSDVWGANGSETLKAMLYPSKEPFWKLNYKGGCQDIFFLSTLERTPEFLKTMEATAEKFKYPISEIGVYIQPVHQGASCHFEFSLPYNPLNEQEVTRMRELYTKASEELLNKGAYYSRPYGIWADMAFNQNALAVKYLKKIKGIFDPNGIMNPGKLCF